MLSCEETKSCTGFLSMLLKEVFILSAILLILAENCACLFCKLQKNKTKLRLFPSVNNRAVLMIPHWTTHGFQNRLNAWRLEGCYQTPSSTWLSYRIDSGTGKLHPARPWTPAQSRSSRRLTQSHSWWSSVPTPRRRPRPARHRGPDPVVEQLDLQPPGWRHCGRTGPTGAGEGRGGPSGSSWSSVGTAGRLKGETTQDTVTAPRAKLAWPELWAGCRDGLGCGGTKSGFYLILWLVCAFITAD